MTSGDPCPRARAAPERGDVDAGDRSVRRRAVSRTSGGASRPALALAVARQVAARAAALRGALLPLAGLRAALGDGVRRAPARRELSARDLRIQRRGAALDVAGLLLRVLRERHRPLSAVHAGRRSRLSGPARGRVSGRPAPRLAADRLVAARRAAVPGRRDLRRRRRGRLAGERDALVVVRRLGRPDRPARARRGRRAAVPRRLPALDLRLRARPQPVGAAGRRLRGADDARVSAVPARRRRERSRRADAGRRVPRRRRRGSRPRPGRSGGASAACSPSSPAA